MLAIVVGWTRSTEILRGKRPVRMRLAEAARRAVDLFHQAGGLAWVAVLSAAAAGCERTVDRGPLDAMADSLFAGTADSVCSSVDQMYGAAHGCFVHRGDTIAYLYSMATGERVVVGRDWPVPGAGLEAAFSMMERRLQATYGPGTSCQHRDSDWQIVDRRWPSPDRYVVLTSMRPLGETYPTPRLALVYARGEVNCRHLFSPPLLR